MLFFKKLLNFLFGWIFRKKPGTISKTDKKPGTVPKTDKKTDTHLEYFKKIKVTPRAAETEKQPRFRIKNNKKRTPGRIIQVLPNGRQIRHAPNGLR